MDSNGDGNKRPRFRAVKATGGEPPRKSLSPKLARDWYYRGQLNRGLVKEVEVQTYPSFSDAQTQTKAEASTTSTKSQTTMVDMNNDPIHFE